MKSNEERIDVAELDSQIKVPFTDTIRGVIKRFTKQKFTTAHVTFVIMDDEALSDGRSKDTVSRSVRGVVASMVEEGRLEVVRESGPGMPPGVYRRK